MRWSRCGSVRDRLDVLADVVRCGRWRRGRRRRGAGADRGDDVGADDRGDEQRAGDDGQGVGRDVGQLQGVAQRAEQRRPPASTPSRPPRPPKMDTPPSSTAATTDSSRPVPLSARALANRSVQKTPASAGDRAGRRRTARTWSGPTRMPANAAASALLPIAYSAAADRRGVQHDAEHAAPGRRRRGSNHGIGRAGDRRDRAAGPADREVGHRPVAEHHVGQAAVERQRADGDRQRRQPEHR